MWLCANSAKFHPRASTNSNYNEGIYEAGDGLQLGRVYHICYALSDTDKCFDIYLDGELLDRWCMPDAEGNHIVFNNGSLRIGYDGRWDSCVSEIR